MLAVLAVVPFVALVPIAGADTAPLAASTDLPWTDAAHQSPLELLAGRIATHIAGRPVAVHCEGDSDWASLVGQLGGDPDAESGYVATMWDPSTGQLISDSGVAELSSTICQPLDNFATAATKPTKCLALAATGQRATAGVTTSAARKRATAARKARRAVQAPGPCYLGHGSSAAQMPASFWDRYARDAVAILTLAHESIHLGGVVGGQLPSGLRVGDQQAEAKADCYGMQWMPYVAEQLGDTPDDAQAIATYFWEQIYPLAKAANPAYWSSECRPGGALDERLAGVTAWP